VCVFAEQTLQLSRQQRKWELDNNVAVLWNKQRHGQRDGLCQHPETQAIGIQTGIFEPRIEITLRTR
jgi:hypothetical protein